GLLCQGLFDAGLGQVELHGGTAVLRSQRSFGVSWLIHPDPRLERDERSSQCSDELLSVPDVWIRHHMLNAREVRWQTPVTDAPHL
ncbi:MAG TPA: hypothetical protein VGH59_06950, partial [Casimicrobiaceae bacterium]